MKRFFLFGLFFILLFLLCSPVDAQEGCGRWLQLYLPTGYPGDYCFDPKVFADSLRAIERAQLYPIDSVWVPEKCDPNAILDSVSSGDWYMQFWLEYPESVKIKIRLDTLWQMAESVWVSDEWKATGFKYFDLIKPDTACWHWEEWWEPAIHYCPGQPSSVSWRLRREKVYEPCEKERR